MSTLENGHILAVEAMASLDLSTLLPGCSANCITDATISSVTSGSVNYLCSDARFSEAIGCAFQNCTVINGLKTQRILSGVCGLPVRDQGTSAAASAIAGALVAVVSVAIREYSQLSRLDYRVGLDDYALILTMSLSLPMSILVVITVQNGLGKDIWQLTPDQINEFFKLFYISEHFYAFTVLFAKTNFLFFYLRLFSDERFRKMTWAVIWTCILSAIGFFFATMFQCWPISYTWTRWDGEHEGRCHDINMQTWIHASVNITLDVIVVVMPLSQILRLNWRWKQKLGAAMMFAVAFLITLVSVLRLESIKSFMKTSNPTWDIVPISNWSFVELNGFIFCSCMPAFRDYFRRLVRRRRLAESTHANQDRIQTIGNLAVRRGNRIHELVSVDSDEGEQNRSEVDVNDRTHNTGRYSVDLNGLHHTSASAQPPADIQVAEPQPEEIDLADLKHLAVFDVPTTQRISEPEKVHTASEEAQI